jgi:hypothetical protein
VRKITVRLLSKPERAREKEEGRGGGVWLKGMPRTGTSRVESSRSEDAVRTHEEEEEAVRT